MGGNWFGGNWFGGNWFGGNWAGGSGGGDGTPVFAMRADRPLAEIAITRDYNAKFRDAEWDPDLRAMAILPEFLAVRILRPRLAGGGRAAGAHLSGYASDDRPAPGAGRRGAAGSAWRNRRGEPELSAALAAAPQHQPRVPSADVPADEAHRPGRRVCDGPAETPIFELGLVPPRRPIGTSPVQTRSARRCIRQSRSRGTQPIRPATRSLPRSPPHA